MCIFDDIKAFLANNHRDNEEIAYEVMNSALDPFARSTLPGHITGSAFVTDVVQRRALLIHHAALGIWIQPGGHVDPGELPVQAALRETLEETGIAGELLSPKIFDIDIHKIPFNPRKGEKEHYHIDVRYLISASCSDSVTISEQECHGYEWPKLESLAIQNESVARMARLALAWIEAKQAA
ncbi:NUDIX hydrolase [Pseudomonas viridiflava]|uniref:NUDIX hydrolase n=1 Tax=Pseudomonas viridiflava TaxID=33069 RepID=UPI000F01ED45|nr:NUDIX hydrolase [Pseudomonas viridiflava]